MKTYFVILLLFIGCATNPPKHYKQKSVSSHPKTYSPIIDSVKRIEKQIYSKTQGLDGNFDLYFMTSDAWVRLREFLGMKIINDSLLIFWSVNHTPWQQSNEKHFIYKLPFSEFKADFDSLNQFDSLKSIVVPKSNLGTTYNFDAITVDGDISLIHWKNSYVENPDNETKPYWDKYPYFIYLSRISEKADSLIKIKIDNHE